MGSNVENEPADNSQNGKGEGRANLSTTRLVEGVRDFFLLQLKQHHMQKPWPQMSEGDQRLWIERITDRAYTLVGDVIEHVNHGHFPKVDATIDSFTVKNGEVKIVAKGFAENEILATLNSAGEKRVQITVIRDDQFDQGMSPLNPDPDEPGLPGVKDNGFEDEIEEDDGQEIEEPEIENPEGEQEAGAEILAPKSAEWKGGFNSRVGGHYRNENPFDHVTNLQAASDWAAGWDAANDADGTPPLKDQAPAGDVERLADETIEPPKSKHYQEGAAAFEAGGALDGNPYVRKQMKEDWERGWLTASQAARTAEPDPVEADELQVDDDAIVDAEPEVEADEQEEDADDIADQNGEIIETPDQAFAYGKWCRQDGRGTGANPFAPGDELGKAWLRGYNEAKREEEF